MSQKMRPDHEIENLAFPDGQALPVGKVAQQTQI